MYIKNFIKNLLIYPQWDYIKRKIKKHENRIALLLGTCVYNNLGDHLISYSEKKFLKKTLMGCELFEIPTPIYLRHRDFLKKYIRLDDLIFITGGGWMGSLWTEDEKKIQLMVGDFNQNTVVILPQTIYYENNLSCTILEDAKKVFSNCKNLIICTRDKKSYETAKENFKKTKCVLAPDMALYLRPRAPKSRKQNQIGICIRNDRESCVARAMLNDFIPQDCSVKRIDTISKLNTIPVFVRSFLVKRKIREFSRFKIIYTDRLHGMIYSWLAGTTCYAFDNRTGKVKGVYEEWLSNNRDLYLIIDDRIVCNLHDKTISAERSNMFQELEEIIRCL